MGVKLSLVNISTNKEGACILLSLLEILGFVAVVCN